ncbi:MAG: hypothetical protein J2P58_10320 [Acidimicrobiaceae bacterium]|nr:hypothetical protein [Acidimicrobiaceae bacterium]
MASLRGQGLSAELPPGFEGRVFRRSAADGAATYPVMHFASFPISAATADFGGGVPATMGPTDIFAVLFQYGPESLGQALFARVGMPRTLSPDHFKPYLLRRGAPGQSGTQWFFTENGKPFTFYAVLGSHALRASLVPKVNRLLSGITISPPSPPSPGAGTNPISVPTAPTSTVGGA